MPRPTFLPFLALLAFAIPAHAQDSKKATSLKLPPAHTAAIADAAEQHDDALVKKLIAQHADVNAAQGDGMTALHWAAEHGDPVLTNELLAAHASVTATTRIGNYTPLHIAAKTGNPDVVRALIKAGADVKAMTTTGATALHLASEAGNPQSIDALLKAGADPNIKEAAFGQTPLIFAAEFNRADAVRALLKAGADPSVHTRVQSIQEETAREQAAEKKRNEVLLSFDPPKVRDSIIAAFKRDSAAAAGNQARAAQDAANSGYGPAVQQQAAQQRFAFGRGPRSPQPKGPFTPEQIQAAIDSGRQVLLNASSGKGPAVEEVDTLNGGVAGFANSVGGVGGLSALHHAVRQGNLAAVVALLDGGANINDTTYVDHTTPLLLAAINGQYDIAMELVKRGADPNIEQNTGMTPLYAALNTQWAPKSRYPQPEAIQLQKTPYLELMEALLKAKANPNVRLRAQPWYFAYNNCGNANCGLENIEGTTAFWRAAYAVDVDAMKLLVKYGADPNIPSQRVAVANARGGRGRRGGGAPGDSSAAGGGARGLRGGAIGGGGGGGRGQIPPPILDPQIDSAAKAVPPGIGVYPIHAAAGVGYGNGFAGNSHRHAPDGWMPAMRYLVEELHADVNQRDNNGYTPLHHAAARGDNEMIQYLVAHGADVRAVARNGRTTVDMANGPVQRLSPIPDTIKLLEKLGAKNTHHCVSCW